MVMDASEPTEVRVNVPKRGLKSPDHVNHLQASQPKTDSPPAKAHKSASE